MVRRDFTNESGYFCPTENAAIREVMKPKPYHPKPSPSVMHEKELKAMDKHRAASEPAAPKKDVELLQVRRLYAALVSIAAMLDMKIEHVELKGKGGAAYKTIGATKTIERM